MPGKTGGHRRGCCTGRRVVRPRALLSLALAAAAVSLALLPATAGAVTGSNPASPSEAPWMVRLFFDFPNNSWLDCTGEIVAHGLILTAGHCVSEGECNPSIQPNKVAIRFSNGQLLTTLNPQITIEPGFSCSSGISAIDQAVVHFSDPWGMPSLPLASAAQVASFVNQGVTVFGAGQYTQQGGVWILPIWVRKSVNGGMFMNPYCQAPHQVCFRYTGSTIRLGDSGGAFVGWVGHWVLLAVTSHSYGVLASGASMADPTARGWLNSQISSSGGGGLGANQFHVMNASGGIYWRSAPDWYTAEAVAGNGFYPNTVIAVSCYQSGAANVPGSSDSMWEQASWVSGSGSGHGWINEHFINDGSAINQPSPGVPPCSSPPPPPSHDFSVMNASGGIYWRSGPDWNTAEAVAGNGFYPGTVISVSCYQSGAANVPGSSDSMWEQASWVSGPGSGHGWINEHFINDGSAINQPSPGVPPC